MDTKIQITHPANSTTSPITSTQTNDTLVNTKSNEQIADSKPTTPAERPTDIATIASKKEKDGKGLSVHIQTSYATNDYSTGNQIQHASTTDASTCCGHQELEETTQGMTAGKEKRKVDIFRIGWQTVVMRSDIFYCDSRPDVPGNGIKATLQFGNDGKPRGMECSDTCVIDTVKHALSNLCLFGLGTAKLIKCCVCACAQCCCSRPEDNKPAPTTMTMIR